MPTTGVFPVHNNIFKVGIKGRVSTDSDMKTIKDLENFAPAIDGNTEEWSSMDQGGWTRRAVTGKSLSFSFSGKRNYGDPGNDYVAGLMLGTGQQVETIFEWTMPSGAKLTMDCVINLTTPAGGDSTNIDGLEFELLSDGKPEFEPAPTTL
ncbi:phage tail tube protein [Paenibacillus sp. FSL R7-0026]|uniref:phage tail tube protein n=1 Tax=Paenibacillus sp. FSL R7-0026 TaxID=2921668 RepID=UPI0030F649BE